MKSKFFLLIAIFSFISCGNSGTKNKNVTENLSNKSDTCEDPDAHLGCYFLKQPATLNNIMNIADNSEAGQRIVIKGQIMKQDGNTPFEELIIYAYHTDNDGYYSKKGDETGVQKWHGHLYGYCKTDSEGKYEIRTIRPQRYPSNDAPAHIHWAVKEPNGNMFYLNDFVFSDDSLVNKDYLSHLRLPGDNGVVELKETSEGIPEGNRITILR